MSPLFLFFISVTDNWSAGGVKACSVFQTDNSTSSPPYENVSWLAEIRQSHRRVGREASLCDIGASSVPSVVSRRAPLDVHE